MHNIDSQISNKNISLYIHFPWCIKKCPYCDFNSHKASNNNHQDYIKHLIQDLNFHHRDILSENYIQSIFFGGGTPSLLSAELVSELLKSIEKISKFLPEIEITLETNPGTIERDSFKHYKAAGINRISLGAQSFQDDKLKALGRIHNNKLTHQALNEIHQSGISNFNIDIMHGLPSQTVSDALYDLKTALNYEPVHLSWYQLTIEPNTLFYHQKPILPNEEILADIEYEGQKIIKQNKLIQYEVSAYSRNPQTQSIHNKNYWLFGDYIGIGAGAHSKITNPDNNIQRIWKYKHPTTYQAQNASYIQGTEIISENEIIYEFILNALRLKNGFDINLFEQRTGFSRNLILPKLQLLEKQGLLILLNDQIKTSPKGYNYLNDVVNYFQEIGVPKGI